MFLILLFFVIGIFAGWLFRKAPHLARIAGALTFGCILVLLFILGFQAGSNPKISSSFDVIGFYALIISLGATLGSILMIWFFQKRFIKR